MRKLSKQRFIKVNFLPLAIPIFNLFINTFNSYALNNLDTQMKNNDDFIDAVNMFDDILVALASTKGLNLCRVFLCLEPCIYEGGKIKYKKYLEWNY